MQASAAPWSALVQNTDRRLFIAAVLQLETMRKIGRVDVDHGRLQASQILKKLGMGTFHAAQQHGHSARQDERRRDMHRAADDRRRQI